MQKLTMKHRVVPFGTCFQAGQGLRPFDWVQPARSEDPAAIAENERETSLLRDNEIAVDVGSQLWELGTGLRVVDHHFIGGPPCASAAVLHKARAIAAWVRTLAARSDCACLWIVTHASPDFDALLSSYLVGSLAEAVLSGALQDDELNWIAAGIHPMNWLPIEAQDTANIRGCAIPRFDWLGRPALAALPQKVRGWAALAAVASRQDNARSFGYDFTLSPPYLLKAAIEVRSRGGRPGLDALHGWAAEFFGDCLWEMQASLCDPLQRPLLESAAAYEAAHAYLVQEAAKYRRDIAGARKARAFLPVASDIKAYMAAVAEEPLLADPAAHKINPKQVDPRLVQPHTHRVVNAVWVSRPESGLFKDFARADSETLPGVHGFEMTLVVNEKSGYAVPNALSNAEYIISLDPERAAGAHLYPLWARLQAMELAALETPEHSDVLCTFAGEPARRGYEKRGQGVSPELFHDPWFDGSPFDFTLIQTPGKAGTRIGPPSFKDLDADPILAVVRSVCEDSVFLSASVEDIAARRDVRGAPERSIDILARPGAEAACSAGCYRLGLVRLDADAGLLGPGLGCQIGPVLYGWLHPESSATLPTDFETRHLVVERDTVTVWSRKGLMVAFLDRPEARAHALQMREWLVDIADCAHSVHRDLEDRVWTGDGLRLHATLDKMERELLPSMARLEWDANQAGGGALRRFFEANGFGAAARSLHTVAEALSHRQTRAAGLELQRSAEWVEIFVMAVYLTELAHKFTPALHYANPEAATALLLLSSVGTVLVGILCLRPYREHHAPKTGRSNWWRLGPIAVWMLLIIGLAIWAGHYCH